MNIKQGRIASKGYAEGLVRIINNYEDLDKVQKGDIMIASQTDINYVPYMDMSAGIITERGGRYSHAAIYSRESKLPCITNVKGVMKAFSDGDYVALDATNNKIYKV